MSNFRNSSQSNTTRRKDSVVIVTSVDHLRELSTDTTNEFRIVLAGGLVFSRKIYFHDQMVVLKYITI